MDFTAPLEKFRPNGLDFSDTMLIFVQPTALDVLYIFAKLVHVSLIIDHC